MSSYEADTQHIYYLINLPTTPCYFEGSGEWSDSYKHTELKLSWSGYDKR